MCLDMIAHPLRWVNLLHSEGCVLIQLPQTICVCTIVKGWILQLPLDDINLRGCDKLLLDKHPSD